jgi:hypothetical protein
MNWEKIVQPFKSNVLQIVLLTLFCIIILLATFQLGFVVGAREAEFSGRWGENYSQNFGGPRGGFMGQMMGRRDLIDAHGVAGEIIKIDNQTLVIKGADNIEKIINVTDKTTINVLNTQLQFTDLQVTAQVIVIGTPNKNGQIDAQLIRVMPIPQKK